MKKIISVILILSFILGFLCLFISCGSDSDNSDPDAILNYILKSYKKNGLTSWWEVVAIYNAGENPADYKGFEELYLSLEGTTNLKMASYVIVADIAVIKGMDKNKFEKYEEYISNLKNLLENPTDKYTINDYIFAYLALKCSGMNFQTPLLYYFTQIKKTDGGFALSGDSGDVDMTAFAIPAMLLLYGLYEPDGPVIYNYKDINVLVNAVEFLESNINENGTFGSYGSENANSTACALSALTGYYKNDENEIIQKISDGLALFKVKDKKQTGYSYLENGRVDTLATAQAAIALGDLRNKTSVWEKLYLEYTEMIKE